MPYRNYEIEAIDSEGNKVMLKVAEISTRPWGGKDTPRIARAITTQDGRKVTRLEKGKYQVEGGEILTSDDPKAL